MKNKNKTLTAEELLNRLNGDEDYLNMRKREEQVFLEEKRLSYIEQKNLLQDLLLDGISITSVWDLVNTKESYPNAIPILIKHLSYQYSDKVKEGIIRALTVKEAKGIAGTALIREFKKTAEDKFYLRWAIGNALTIVATNNEAEGILQILTNKDNGELRNVFVRAFGKLKYEKVEDILIGLLNDEMVANDALVLLGKLKSKKAITPIIRLLDNKNAVIKKNAREVLKKLTRS